MSESSSRKKERMPLQSVEEITKALAAPFELSEVKFKPAVVSGNRALALAYIDARVIQDRLDEVLGVEGWQDNYKCLEDGSVVCRLRLRLGNEWITKMDVGGPSEQPDGGDRLKAAFSDALKRAAVKFGVGRYLYRLPQQWVDYDNHRRQFARTPTLPPFALPNKQKDKNEQKEAVPAAASETSPAARKPGKKSSPTLPVNGSELQRRLHDYDAKLAAQSLCPQGALVKYIVEAGVKAGYGADLASWTEPGMLLAAEEARAFEARVRSQKPNRKEVA